jgi:hypothetical protein
MARKPHKPYKPTPTADSAESSMPASAPEPTPAPIKPKGLPEIEGVAVDWDFLAEREGGLATVGYVPQNEDGSVIGQSGVTIGIGVDLGQHGGLTITAWGASRALLDKLRPYLGLRGENALKALAAKPLELSEDEAQLLTDGAKRMILMDLLSRYDLAANGRKFSDLSPGAQTALLSVAYQYGTRLDVRTPRFWNRAVNGNEAAMKAELWSFGDAYRSRRRLESALIKLKEA